MFCQKTLPSFFSKSTTFPPENLDPYPSVTTSSTINFSNYSSIKLQKPNEKPKKVVKKPSSSSAQTRLSSFFCSKNKNNTDTKENILPFSKTNIIHEKSSGLNPKVEYCEDKIKEWVYLTSKSIRKYQLQMVEIALFYNTLVCLPTGLGKTFIAAMVMLNYYLWFPKGKIFFLAPTRPLVTQQKAALNELNSIEKSHIFEITGGLCSEKRVKLYRNEKKRVFFMTPQTLENDILEQRVDVQSIVLIVFDEAHRATGDYSYSKIIRLLEEKQFGYRVLALSASPGNNLTQVQEVITNLCINKLELKDENDEDVKPYMFFKEVVSCIIPKNESVEQISDKLNEIIMKYFRKIPAINDVMKDKGFCFKMKEISRGFFMEIFDKFRKNQELYMKYGKAYISTMYEYFSVISSLLYGKSLISTQGMMSFKLFLDNFSTNIKNKNGKENKTKQEIANSPEFQLIKESLAYISNKKTHHPKLIRLRELLSEYFNSLETIQNNSKAIIFTQSRSTAYEISQYLNENPRILSSIFIGQSGRFSKKPKANFFSLLEKYNHPPQGKENSTNICSVSKNLKEHQYPGLSQKEQISIINSFKSNKINTLIATCIGEEGLDIGDVDLIICYDSGFSPIRMIQRKGRTGRHRNGKVIMMLMEGKELGNYQQSIKKSEILIKTLKKCSLFEKNDDKYKATAKKKTELNFFSFNPRMIPDDVIPKLSLKEYLLANQEEENSSENDEKMKKNKNSKKGKNNKNKKNEKNEKKDESHEQIENPSDTNLNEQDEAKNEDNCMQYKEFGENFSSKQSEIKTEHDESFIFGENTTTVKEENNDFERYLDTDNDENEVNCEQIEEEIEKLLSLNQEKLNSDENSCKNLNKDEKLIETHEEKTKSEEEPIKNKEVDEIKQNDNNENMIENNLITNIKEKNLSDSFDSEVDKAIDEILLSNNCKNPLIESDEDEDEIIEKLLLEHERNDKKRKMDDFCDEISGNLPIKRLKGANQ